ncbi:hypothetical protein HDU67_004928, partial [Dinochytrium kinnereticum]
MTWREYCKWVRENFASQLTLQQAIESLDKIEQKGAATLYSQQFNELVAAIASSGIEYPEVILCFNYCRGLKPILRSNEDLFQIQDDLPRLQRATERLDDFHWREGTHKRNLSNNGNYNSNQLKGRDQSFRNQRQENKKGNQSDGATPMEIDNTKAERSKLTDQEKATYRANGWCASCRSHKHRYEDCVPRAFKATASKVPPESATVPRNNPPPKPKAQETRAPLSQTTSTTKVERAPDSKSSVETSAVQSTSTQTPPPDSSRVIHTLKTHHVHKQDNQDHLLVIQGTINDRPAKILIDGGATPSFVKDSLAYEIGKPSSDDHFNIKLAASTSRTVKGRLFKNLDLSIDAYSTTQDFISAPIAYDVILGKDWLSSINPRIDWTHNTVTFENHRWTC